VPADWRERQTGVSEAEFVDFQKWWFAELHRAGYAVPHWPAEWGGGMPVDRQVVLYQELAAADAPRLVLAFVGIHHAATTLLVAGTDGNANDTCPRSSTARSGCRASPSPRPALIWPACAPRHAGTATAMW
jgi:alkylation response protein AidB-like acyl-CoA dehydrogenase